ncbi:uncharacterized protein LOC141901803 [Tubulanus polymorphus]|uniref:uncharacterized protein LOC141901803 n=1 Tax=Tubulanus polymorphus TaxID=672921 RepID=UPI003DA38EA9
MANNEDDLVNLGPFMANYVLNSNLNGGVSPQLLLLPKPSNIKPVLAPKSTSAQYRMCMSKSDYVGNVQCGPPVKKKCVRVMTVSKSRKSNRLTEKQQRVKKWLQSAYVFCPKAKTLKISSHIVLMRACRVFGPMTQKALVFLVQQAFPYVKITTDSERAGHFFTGIMEKPNDAAIYRRTRFWNNAIKLDANITVSDSTNEGTSSAAVDKPLSQTSDESEIKQEPVDQGYESHNSETDPAGSLLIKSEPVDDSYEKTDQQTDSEATEDALSDEDEQLNTRKGLQSHLLMAGPPSTVLSSASYLPRTTPLVQVSPNANNLTTDIPLIPQASIPGGLSVVPCLPSALFQLSPAGLVQNLSSNIAQQGTPILANLAMQSAVPQDMFEAQKIINNLITYVKHREAKFKELHDEFSNLSNEFRKLTHAFKAFEQEGNNIPFLAARNSVNNV